MITIQQRKQQLHGAAAQHRSTLNNLRGALDVARGRYRQSGHATDEKAVADLALRVREAEQTLDSVLDEIRKADEPRPVILHSSAEATRQRLCEMARRIAHRDQKFEERVEIERQHCRGMSEAHFKIHLRNVLGTADAGRQRDNAADQAVIDDCNAQLAEHARLYAAERQGAA